MRLHTCIHIHAYNDMICVLMHTGIHIPVHIHMYIKHVRTRYTHPYNYTCASKHTHRHKLYTCRHSRVQQREERFDALSSYKMTFDPASGGWP